MTPRDGLPEGIPGEAVWDERYHARSLRSPRELRNALVYVLMNFRKHGHAGSMRTDPCSSARWFDGWKRSPVSTGPLARAVVAQAQSWLAKVGWRRLGAIDIDESPASARRPPHGT